MYSYLYINTQPRSLLLPRRVAGTYVKEAIGCSEIYTIVYMAIWLYIDIYVFMY